MTNDFHNANSYNANYDTSLISWWVKSVGVNKNVLRPWICKFAQVNTSELRNVFKYSIMHEIIRKRIDRGILR